VLTIEVGLEMPQTCPGDKTPPRNTQDVIPNDGQLGNGASQGKSLFYGVDSDHGYLLGKEKPAPTRGPGCIVIDIFEAMSGVRYENDVDIFCSCYCCVFLGRDKRQVYEKGKTLLRYRGIRCCVFGDHDFGFYRWEPLIH